MPASFGSPHPAADRPAGLVAVDGRLYPLEAVSVSGHAEGGLACTTLTQSYRNPYDEPLEVLYTLPLPADGAVLGYVIHLGERVIRAEVMKREQAAEVYEQAMREGRAAALLEQDRDDTFTQRLGSLPAGVAARVEIQVLHPLAFVPAVNGASARWEYRFPTVTGVRYEGRDGRVPDAGRLDVDRDAEGGIPTRLEVDLVLADGPPEELAAESTTHDIACEPDGKRVRVRLRHVARLNHDLVVRWIAAVEDTGARLVEGAGLAGDDGRYGLLTLVPPPLPPHGMTRDLTILLDASGSMTGAPLRWAKEIVAGLLAGLEPEDRFELLAFSDRVRSLTDGKPLPGGRDEVKRALQSLQRLEAGGSTEMAEAIIASLRPLREASQRQVVLVTDGFIGFEAQVVGEILRRLPPASRVHAVGVGPAPNRALLAAVARAGRGVEVIASDEFRLDEAVARLRRATARPLLTGVEITGSALRSLAPARPTDVMAGRPLVVALELEPAGGSLEVRASQAGAADTWIWRIDVPPLTGDGVPRTPIAVGALFGRETIADLELNVAAAQEDASRIDARIEACGLRHRIASRLTSLVAFAEEPSVDPRAPRRRERLPVEMPEGASIEGVGLHTRAMSLTIARYAVAPTEGLSRTTTLSKLAMGSLTERLRASRPAGDSLASTGFDLPRTPDPDPLVIPTCRVVRCEGNLLVIEFEAPVDAFELPAATISGWDGSKRPLQAEDVRDLGSSTGPHPSGSTIRYALRVPEGRSWSNLSPVTLSYRTRARTAPGDRVIDTVELQITIPSPTPDAD